MAAKRVLLVVRVPAGLPAAIVAAVPEHGATQTAVVEAALERFLAGPSAAPAMQHARILLDRGVMATGQLTPFGQVSYLLDPDLRARLYARADADGAKVQSVFVAAVLDLLAPDHERAVLDLAAAMLQTHGRDLRSLLNDVGVDLLGGAES